MLNNTEKNTGKLRAIRHTLGFVGKELSSRGVKPEMSLKTLPSLNRKIWGVQPKRLYVVGARTSQGKSALVLQIAWDIASQGHGVLFLSLEMTTGDMVERLFCLDQKVNNSDLLTGGFNKYKSEWAAFNRKTENMSLILSEGIGKSWQDIDGLVHGLNPKPKVIILDYIQCIAGSSVEKRESIDEYIRHFRQMAIENNFCAILCSQINRASVESGNKEPSLNNLKGSGFIEEHADKVILLHYPYSYGNINDSSEFHLYLAKNRNGRTGQVKLRFIPENYRFEDNILPDHKIPEEVKSVADQFGGKVLRERDLYN